MIFGKGGGWRVFGPKNKPGEHERQPGLTRATRTSSTAFAEAPKRRGIGHQSAAARATGHIATHIGRVLRHDPKKEEIL